ncbi:MAG: FAD-dependent oxidoreductase [Cyclobacteriaceae bacterium]|nr:FAD-dependent oxidoreductase [Cyclobacteriaceae bacterium]
MNKGKVIVLGGGVIGLCSAYYLKDSGFEVTILDKGDFSSGTSFGNAGMIVPSHFVPLAQPGIIAKGIKWMFDAEGPFYVKPRFSWSLLDWGWKFYQHSSEKHVQGAAQLLKELNLESKKLYVSLCDQLEDIKIDEKGLIMYCQTQRGLDEEVALADQAMKLGLKAIVMDNQQLNDLDSNLTLDVKGGVYFSEDAFFSPKLFLEKLKSDLKAADVKMVSHVDNLKFVVHEDLKSIDTNQGLFSADQFVISAGVWTGKLAQFLGLNIPMQPGKGYSFTLEHPIETPSICSILTEAKVAVTPMLEGLRFAGTMEIGALNFNVDQRRVHGIKKSIGKYFPSFKMTDFNEAKIWTGLRPCSPDGLPYIGRTKKLPNVLLATGHGMMGMSLGPITGKLIAEIADNQSPGIEISKLAVERFH